MTARVLVVDDIPANVKLLEARLAAEYFDVLCANSGAEALEVISRERVDVVLLDVMMPGMDGFEVCQRIKTNPRTHHIPVVMVTALDQPSDRVQGLENGADDFLTKPVDDIALITRVKSLARLKTLNDEMLMRVATGRELGSAGTHALNLAMDASGGRILIVEDHAYSAERLCEALVPFNHADIEPDPQQALIRLTNDDYDLVIVSLSLETCDGLRLCSQLRSLERTRHLPVMMVAEQANDARLLRGLDMGINDYLVRPIERHELLARSVTQIKRKRFSDYLRTQLDENAEAAFTDPLTGLHNRRYMDGHLRTLVSEAAKAGRPLSIMVADIDHFKQVNDTYGHAVGDLVLVEFSSRLRRNTRSTDLPCRLGGEEFVVIMPDTELTKAYQMAERLRVCIAASGFAIRHGSAEEIRITTSLGLATLEDPLQDTPASLIDRADAALYAAKHRGRNRVMVQQAA